MAADEGRLYYEYLKQQHYITFYYGYRVFEYGYHHLGKWPKLNFRNSKMWELGLY